MNNSDSLLKQCSKCKEWKDRNQDFHKDKSKSDGLNPRCKKCMSVTTHKWYEENSEYAKERQKKYAKEHPNYWPDYCKRYPDRVLWYQRSEENRKRSYVTTLKWMKENPEKNAARVRNWRNRNPQKVLEIASKWRRNNLDKAIEIARRRYYETYKDKAEYYKERARIRRVLKAGSGGNLTPKEWREILEFYGNICLCCGTSGDRTPEGQLTQDHIIPLSKGGTHTKDNIQPLCKSCNSSKSTKIIDYRYGLGECVRCYYHLTHSKHSGTRPPYL